MTPNQIKHMVNRFLGWKLPASFNPDGGVSFRPSMAYPSGTNLFDAGQAFDMVNYMVEGLQDVDAASVADQVANEHEKTRDLCSPSSEAWHQAHWQAKGARDVAHRLRYDAGATEAQKAAPIDAHRKLSTGTVCS